MELTKTRKWGQNEVELVTSTVEEWKGFGEGKGEIEGKSEVEGKWEGERKREAEYDCVLTGFFFDNFKEVHAAEIVRRLTPLLKRGGYWLEAEFYYPRGGGKLWQAILLYMMYISARLICGVEAKRLPDMDRIFMGEGYRLLRTTFHYQRFIRSVVYRKL
jgi:hypothetical protein